MLSIFVSFALLASAITANKIVLMAMQPTFFVFLRMLLAGLMLYAFFVLRQHWQGRSLSQIFEHIVCKWRRDWKVFIGLGCLITLIPAICKAYALKYMISGEAAAFGCLDPFVTAMYMMLIWHERLDAYKIGGIILGMSGGLVLAFGSMPTDELYKGFCFFSYPELAMVAAVAIGRLGWIFAQRFLRRERMSSLEFNAAIMVCSGVMSLMMFLCEGQGFAAFGHALRAPFFNPIILAAFGYTVIVGNGLGYTMYAWVLKKHSVVLVSLASISVPLFVALFGWFVLGEIVNVYFAYAIVLFLIGILVFNAKPIWSMLWVKNNDQGGSNADKSIDRRNDDILL